MVAGYLPIGPMIIADMLKIPRAQIVDYFGFRGCIERCERLVKKKDCQGR